MKKSVIVLLLICGMFLLAGCSSKENPLLGTWNGMFSIDNNKLAENFYTAKTTFNEDRTFSFSLGELTADGNYKLTKDSIIYSKVESNMNLERTFEEKFHIQDEILTLTSLDTTKVSRYRKG